MENGAYVIQTNCNGVDNLSAARNLVLRSGGAVAATAIQTDLLGVLQQNAETIPPAAGESINVTIAGTATCIVGAVAIGPFVDVMVDAANPGRVILHTSGGANVALGRYIPELRDGAPILGAPGTEVTVHLYGSITIY